MSKKLQNIMSPEEIWNLIDEVEKASDDCTSQELIDTMVRAAKEEADASKSVGKDRAEALKEYYGHVKANTEEVSDVTVEEDADVEEKKSPEEMYHMYFPEFLGKSPEELSFIEASWYIEKSSYIKKRAWNRVWNRAGGDNLKITDLVGWLEEISPRVHGRKAEFKLKIPRVNTPLSEGVQPVRRFFSTKDTRDIIPKLKRSDFKEEVNKTLSDLEKMFLETNDGKTRVPSAVITKSRKKDVEPENVETENVEVVETEEEAAPVADEVIFRASQEKNKTIFDKIGDSITALVDWIFGWLK